MNVDIAAFLPAFGAAIVDVGTLRLPLLISAFVLTIGVLNRLRAADAIKADERLYNSARLKLRGSTYEQYAYLAVLANVQDVIAGR